MAKIVQFHASYDVISKFKPLSHFGPRQAAEEAVQNKNKGQLPRPGYMYKVEMDLGGSVIHLNDDQGTPRPVGYLYMLFAANGSPHHDYALFQQHRTALAQIYGPPPPNPFKNDHPNDAAARQYVADVFTGLGYTGMEYVNLVESPGSTAFVILESSQVSIIAQESIMVPPRQNP